MNLWFWISAGCALGALWEGYTENDEWSTGIGVLFICAAVLTF